MKRAVSIRSCRKYILLLIYFISFVSIVLFIAISLGILSREDVFSIVFPVAQIISGSYVYTSVVYCESPLVHGVLFNMLTKLNIYYSSDQWFHMGENFLVQLHLLDSSNRLSDSSVLFYNFDADGFVENLNPFTRFIVYISTKEPEKRAQILYFLNEKQLWVKTSNVVNKNILVDFSLVKNSFQSLDVSDKIPTPERFVVADSIENNDFSDVHSMRSFASYSKQCLAYAGTIGGKRIKRGEWFPNVNTIKMLRQNIRDACPRNESLIRQFEKKKKHKLLIYQRDKSRKFLYLEKSVEMLWDQFSSSEWEIQIVLHQNDVSPCYLSHVLSNVDILVTPHGFQSMLMLFLPIPSLLFEVFPYGYHKVVYRTLANELGISHGYYQSEATFIKPWDTLAKVSYWILNRQCAKLYLCRATFRNQHVWLDRRGVAWLRNLSEEHTPLFQQNPVYSTAILNEKTRYQPYVRDSLYE